MTPTLESTDTALAAFANDVGQTGAITIEGARTRWSLGGHSDAGTRQVKAPEGIIDYLPEEMTVRVRCGTAVEELEHVLAERGQRCALPYRGGTVGGALAAGENHFEVLGRGTVRSSALQIRYVSAEGRVITTGGPTVKNVTGFDLPRIMVGSLGTLGCLGEAILRTNPTPVVRQWFRCDDADPFETYSALLSPSAVVWDGETTSVLLEGHRPDVHAQAACLVAVGSFRECDPVTEPAGFRWSLRPADLRSLGDSGTGSFLALIGVGTVIAEHPQPPRPLSPAVQELHHRVKSLFDPTGRLNPGRSVGGD